VPILGLVLGIMALAAEAEHAHHGHLGIVLKRGIARAGTVLFAFGAALVGLAFLPFAFL
jgi:hypothetical protein